MDYHKLDQMATPSAAAVPDVVSLPEQISTFLDVWYAAMDLASASSSLPVNQDHAKQLSRPPTHGTSLSCLRDILPLQLCVIV